MNGDTQTNGKLYANNIRKEIYYVISHWLRRQRQWPPNEQTKNNKGTIETNVKRAGMRISMSRENEMGKFQFSDEFIHTHTHTSC